MMTAQIKRAGLTGGIGAAMALVATPALADVPNDIGYIFNSLSFLMHGFIVMWMAAGFAMLEAGLVRSKNTAAQCLKNIGLYSIAGLMFYLIGYNLMYLDVSSYIGSLAIWDAGDTPVAADLADGVNYSAGSDWFFQMVFVAATASIVSGTVAERVKLWPFFLFVVVLTGIIYPVQGSWTWGGGWLKEMGFSDFAGSTIVHSVGGWAALAGALVIGARKGKYGADGRINPMVGANLPLATLGTFILWMGWFGFNGASQLAMGTIEDVTAISNIYVNTNLAAAAGVVVAMILTQILYKKIDLTMALNGALGGLVAITAEPLAPNPMLAIFIGGVGGALVVVAIPLLDKLKIDDVVGAISVHLVAGVWGTLAVVFSGANFFTQMTGIIAIGAFVFILSFVTFHVMRLTIGVRVDEETEHLGLDKSDLGMEAYPEFGSSSSSL